VENQPGAERVITFHIHVPASLSQVWQAWTTEEGTKSFFAPQGRIDLKPGGAYEMLFDLEAEPGKQGGEGMVLLAVQPERMLSFTWNAPPHLPNVRGQMTHVVVRLFPMDSKNTRVTLRHDGWGDGEEWDAAFQYFSRVWGDVVLPRLQYRFERGAIDWNNPPAFHKSAEASA
jgi:uncharacterized protein YndB with AHSA1/START domain